MSKDGRGPLYVDKDVQRALIWQLLRQWALFIAMLTGMLLVLQLLRSGPGLSLSEHCQSIWSNYAPLYVVILAILPVFVWDLIRLSHRFVGPILRVRRSLRQLAAGESVEPLKFREHDFWQDFAVSFNQLLKRLTPGDAQTDCADCPDNARELAACGTDLRETNS